MTLKFKEPAPITDDLNPLESMMERFDEAAKILGLDESTYNALKSPEKAVIVSLPVTMDNGKVQVFQGYRVIHSSKLGPSKGGVRYSMGVNLDEVKALAKYKIKCNEMVDRKIIIGIPLKNTTLADKKKQIKNFNKELENNNVSGPSPYQFKNKSGDQ